MTHLWDDRPSGLKIIENYIDQDDHDHLLWEIDRLPWDETLVRRTQQYGFEYRYALGRVNPKLTPMPEFLKDLAGILVDEGHVKTRPNSVIVNEYQPGQGIGNHKDSASFGEEIVSLSLGSQVRMDFTGPNDSTYSCDLFPTDLLILSGDARWVWTHGIAKRLKDAGISRRRRVSITFRHVTLNAPITVDAL